MKITKLLPVTLALLLGMSGAYAVTDTSSAKYELQLNEYFDVSSVAPAEAATATYSGDYDSIELSTITGTFHVTSNTDTKNIFFYATCPTGETETAALFGTAAAPKIVFTNTQIGSVNNQPVTSTNIASLKANLTDKTLSPNAIVLPLTITPALVANSFPTGKAVSAPELVDTNNVKYSIPNCKVNFTCSVGGAAESFSTLDTNGKYQATLYLSDTKQTL